MRVRLPAPNDVKTGEADVVSPILWQCESGCLHQMSQDKWRRCSQPNHFSWQLVPMALGCTCLQVVGPDHIILVIRGILANKQDIVFVHDANVVGGRYCCRSTNFLWTKRLACLLDKPYVSWKQRRKEKNRFRAKWTRKRTRPSAVSAVYRHRDIH